MKRKPVILMAAVLTVLFSGLSVYGYWTDKVEAKCNLSFAVPVHVQIRGEEALIIDMDKAEEAIPLSPVPEEDIAGVVPDGEEDSGMGSDLNSESGAGENTGAETVKDGGSNGSADEGQTDESAESGPTGENK